MARKKELSEEERKKELVRKLKKGPDLEKYLEGRKRTFVSYAQGARMYSMSYCTFIKFVTCERPLQELIQKRDYGGSTCHRKHS